jgi:protein transport protein SEC24
MIICPMAGDEGISNENVPVVDFGSTGIVRCKRCRTYINPFVVWNEGGRKWKCNICGLNNETPQSYFSNLDGKKLELIYINGYISYILSNYKVV